MQARLSRRITRLGPSPVREILAAASGRDVISLAGGLPDASTFPVGFGLPPGWEQYGLTEGDAAVREAVSLHLRRRGLDCPASRILLTHGSQQGIDLAAKLLVDEGTEVTCQAPTYVAALQVFRLFGASLRGVDLSIQDPVRLRNWLAERNPDLFYAIPSGNNPTGATWTEAMRDALAQAADAQGFCVLEDDPYGEIWFDAPPPAPVCARVKTASWIFLGSFSKSYVPGLRLGFLAASEDLFVPLERLKQAADLHSNRLSQALVLADLVDPCREERLDALRAAYREKRDRFAASLARHFPQARWELPGSGLFFWAELAPGRDLRPLGKLALEAGVAFLPGEHCYPNEPELGWARLNFSHATPEQADEGLRRLARVFAGF
jgi:DNA-binding transcriptional MocR family regulator